jgi:hypothetical protein
VSISSNKTGNEADTEKVPFNFQTLDVLNLMQVAAPGSGAFPINVLFAHDKYF